MVCIAEKQTKGRGRFNRYWHSPFAQNIYLSCLYPFKKDISELTGLGFVVGLAIAEALKFYKLADDLCIKWPNDIVYEGKKLAGSLIEVQAESHGYCHAVIGLSVNCNLLEDSQDKINQPWTSLVNILGSYIDRNDLCIRIINNLVLYINRFEKSGLNSFLKEWEAKDFLFNKQITLSSYNKKTSGMAMGINDQGHLLLKLDDGEIESFSSGDTTILKEPA